MSTCKPVILAEGPHYCVSQCSDCLRVNLQYHHIMIGFEDREFRQFTRQFLGIDYDKYAVRLADGSQRLILKSPHPDIHLQLSKQEFNEIFDLLQQSQLMFEVWGLI